jgi:ribosome-associated translation inhibitor RaiA
MSLRLLNGDRKWDNLTEKDTNKEVESINYGRNTALGARLEKIIIQPINLSIKDTNDHRISITIVITDGQVRRSQSQNDIYSAVNAMHMTATPRRQRRPTKHNFRLQKKRRRRQTAQFSSCRRLEMTQKRLNFSQKLNGMTRLEIWYFSRNRSWTTCMKRRRWI